MDTRHPQEVVHNSEAWQQSYLTAELFHGFERGFGCTDHLWVCVLKPGPEDAGSPALERLPVGLRAGGVIKQAADKRRGRGLPELVLCACMSSTHHRISARFKRELTRHG